MSYETVHPAIKEQFCEYIYENHILNSYKVLSKFEDYGHTFNISLPVSCYTNFRDALFHFRKVVYSTEEKEMECQAFAVKEHLSRVNTDACVSYLNLMFDLARELINDDSIDDCKKSDIRKLLHKLKEQNLFKRLNGMMISDDNTFNIEICTILEQIDEFHSYLQHNCKDQFILHMSDIAIQMSRRYE